MLTHAVSYNKDQELPLVYVQKLILKILMVSFEKKPINVFLANLHDNFRWQPYYNFLS